MLKATVSGSFHRHMPAIYSAVNELRAANVNVLSPSDPRVVGYLREFLFVASDRTRLKKLVQQRHLEAITNSHFLWLVCPDGYLGVSAAMEIGWALSVGVPVFAERSPTDVTAEDFVQVVPSLRDAIAISATSARAHRKSSSILLDPDTMASSVSDAAEQTRAILTGKLSVPSEEANQIVRNNADLVCNAFKTLAR
jgi:hypothetical protein